MGRLIHYDHRTGQERIISVWPEAYGMGTPPSEHRYRFQWTFPVFYSRWDPRELWIAGNRIFRSVDEGQSWEIMTGDLTRNDATKLGSPAAPSRGTTPAPRCTAPSSRWSSRPMSATSCGRVRTTASCTSRATAVAPGSR